MGHEHNQEFQNPLTESEYSKSLKKYKQVINGLGVALIVGTLGALGFGIYALSYLTEERKVWTQANMINWDDALKINGLNVKQYTPRVLLIRNQLEGYAVDYDSIKTQKVLAKIDEKCEITGQLPSVPNGSGGWNKVLPITTRLADCKEIISR
ncbi:MAG: hypothetical protein Q7R43_05680 [Candidatus Daviesbacteria bacterium]|nr:hypothetical protein [Candidatus Daviesbacteria bacterium]